MAFGNRAKRSSSRRKARLENSQEEEEDELLTWSEKNPGKLQGLVVLASLSVTLCFLLASSPHTYAAKKVNYNTGQMVEGSLSSGLLPEYKAEAEARMGIDFSRILTRASNENTEAMKLVAGACLPKADFKNFLMPGGGNHLRMTYGYATDYLICAMTQNLERLCESRERKRLVEQLLQYRERRQNLLGLERYEKRLAERIAKSAAAQYQIKMTRQIQGFQTQHRTAPSVGQSIGADVDPRIIAGISSLVSNGYLSGFDFGWLGLYLPEEYVDALGVGRRVRSCG